MRVRGLIHQDWITSDGMVYTRGSTSDFDRFAKITQDPGWSWDELQPYIKRVTSILRSMSLILNGLVMVSEREI